MWTWATTASFLVKAGRATISISMPPGMTLKHRTFDRCEHTGDLIVKGQLTAFNFVPPIYKEDGSSSKEAFSGYEGDGSPSRTPEHH